MSLWWDSLTGIQQIFAITAIPATIILILQTIMLLFGLVGHGDADVGHDHDCGLPDHDHDFEHDHDHDHANEYDGSLRIFTVRAFVAFFTIFGWTGLVLTKGGLSSPLSITVSFFAGAAAMVAMAYFFKFAIGLQSTGNIDMRNSLGKTATVYIPIPPNRTGKGKITLIVQDRLTEADAVTDSDFALKTGSEAVVIGVTSQNEVCVTPVSSMKSN